MEMNSLQNRGIQLAVSFLGGVLVMLLLGAFFVSGDSLSFGNTTISYSVEDGLDGITRVESLKVDSAKLSPDFLTIIEPGGRAQVFPLDRVVRFSCRP